MAKESRRVMREVDVCEKCRKVADPLFKTEIETKVPSGLAPYSAVKVELCESCTEKIRAWPTKRRAKRKETSNDE